MHMRSEIEQQIRDSDIERDRERERETERERERKRKQTQWNIELESKNMTGNRMLRDSRQLKIRANCVVYFYQQNCCRCFGLVKNFILFHFFSVGLQ